MPPPPYLDPHTQRFRLFSGMHACPLVGFLLISAHAARSIVGALAAPSARPCRAAPSCHTKSSPAPFRAQHLLLPHTHTNPPRQLCPWNSSLCSCVGNVSDLAVNFDRMLTDSGA
jgi:hypothetical protein